jgi:hypothetical protein
MLLLPLLVALAQAGQAPAATAATAAPTAVPAPVERVRVLVFDVKPTGGVPPDTAENLTGLIAAILSEDDRLEVLAGPDLRSMLDLESQKEALGCSSSTSCLAEAAGALNARFVLVGDAGFLGTLINLNMSLYDQSKATNIGRRAVQAASLDLLPAALRPALTTLVVQAVGVGTTTTAPVPADDGPGMLPWLTTGVGGAALVTGGVVMALGIAPALALASEEENFRKGDDTALDRAAGIQRDSYESGTAPAMVGIGAALAVVGAGAAIGGVMWAMGAGE